MVFLSQKGANRFNAVNRSEVYSRVGGRESTKGTERRRTTCLLALRPGARRYLPLFTGEAFWSVASNCLALAGTGTAFLNTMSDALTSLAAAAAGSPTDMGSEAVA